MSFCPLLNMSQKGQGSSSKLRWPYTWREDIRCALMHQNTDVHHYYCKENTDHSWQGREYHFLKFHQIILEGWHHQPFHLDLQKSKGCSSKLNSPPRKVDNLCCTNTSNSFTLQESLHLCQLALKEDISSLHNWKHLLLGNHNFHPQECFELIQYFVHSSPSLPFYYLSSPTWHNQFQWRVLSKWSVRQGWIIQMSWSKLLILRKTC